MIGGTEARVPSETDPQTSETPMVAMRDVGKVFVTERMETRALADVDLTVRRGEYLRIEGPSGCGKSTLLGVIGLIEEATGGDYRLDGVPVAGLSRTQRARLRNRLLGFVFQSFNLVGDMTIVDNVELPLRYRGGIGQRERRERAMALLDRVDLAPRAAHYPAQLSGGQQQRAAIARALVGEPALLLADEPTGNLDAQAGGEVMELLAESHASGATVCVVSHDPAYAHMAERAVRLDQGRVIAP